MRSLPFLALLTIFLLYPLTGRTAEHIPASAPVNQILFNGELIATEITKVTGCAISPLLGISVLGAYTYYTTPDGERSYLPWHASPGFWAPLLVVLLGIILKDSAKVALPKIIMVPLDAAETLLEKNTSAVLALVVLLTSITGKGLDQLHFSATAHAAAEAIPLTAPSAAGALELGALALLITVIYTVVWIVSQSFNILIFLCPFSWIDLLLTLWKNSVIALLLGASLLHPFAGLTVSLLIILISFLLFSWSYRFVLLGTLMAFDLLRGPTGTLPAHARIRAFSSKELPETSPMSYGSLRRTDQTLTFTYRPWLLLPPRTVTLRDDCAAYRIGKGRFSAVLIREGTTPGKYATLCRLRPRYNSHEEQIAATLGVNGVRDVTFGKTLQDGFSWLREQFAR